MLSFFNPADVTAQLSPDLGLWPRIAISSAEPELTGPLRYFSRASARPRLLDQLVQAMFIRCGSGAMPVPSQDVTDS
jgi:hypothetical protein